MLCNDAGATHRRKGGEVMYFQKYRESTYWRWRLKAANHEIIASGESYVNQSDCDHAIDLVKATNANTPVYTV